MLAGTTRWPSSRVRVRIVPRPRSENELRPCEPLEVLNVPVVAPVDPCKDGSWAMVVKMFGSALRSRSARPRTWVGVGVVKPVDRMRVPVTTISDSDVVLGSAGGAGACADWALADPADAIIATALVASNICKKGEPLRVRPKVLILQPPVFR
jgi:hypothetical protein